MNKWQIEKLLGHNIPFLERSLNKKHLEKTDIIHSTNCCSIILNSYNLNFETTNPIFTIFVNFKNSFFTSRTQVFTEKISDNSFASSIYFYNNDCDNIMHINIVIQDENKFYFFSGDIMLCKVMQEDKEFDKCIKMYEDMYFMKEKLKIKGDKWIEIGYNVFSTKGDNDIHLYDTIDELYYVNDKSGCKAQNGFANENVIPGVDCQKTIKVEYNSRIYEMCSNKCIFCCREYKTMFNLQKHIFLSHLYHKTLVNGGKLTIIEKTKDELANTYLSGFAYLEKTVLKMIGSKKQNLEYRRVGLIFIRTSYKRKLTTKKYKMKMKRYVNEIMIDVKDYVLDDWMIAQKKQQLKEFVDIEPDKLVMMNLWNGFVFKKGNSINKYNIHAKLVEFLRQMPRSRDMLDILTMMYQKKIITQQDIHEIIDEATKT